MRVKIDSLFVYFIIFISSQIFQVVLIWDALRFQNTIQIIGFLVFHFCCFGYSIIQWFQLSSFLSTFKVNNVPKSLVLFPIIIAGVVLLFQIIFMILSWKLYQEFGWKIYKRIGADLRMKERFRAYQIFLLLIKMDVFFFLGFCVQFLVLVLRGSDVEIPLTIAALPLMVLTLVLAIYGMRRENKIMVKIFLFGLFCGAGYFAFKIIKMWIQRHDDKYQNVIIFLSFFAALSLIMILLTIIQTWVCYQNFGKGLKVYIQSSPHGIAHAQQAGERYMTLEDD
ncbi:hypothetical protein K493DRAFT_276409 [Basidiobolus meristosporus CBS 931.73]|uniref:Uncharacterized protein n=1 Tax=Basidiobolus meristosporus CBS 931.73 TaxID=1314790 RepID=A0A1Y1Z074_9FUNG|nr:hypothetical protein K493DRAFT_276409 [Basidiobolus meristosporus CBS 931.73]|eukprot:ORY03609.1 hypothetical protein K493DRAFT_276409 [Basidiobolus meristosporus CBS 931.73]